jgi:CBS domain-containing protein
MTVGDVMTKDPVSCRIGDTLNQAAQLMWDCRVGAVPVLDDGRRVVGVVTDRDAAMAAYTQGARMNDVPVSTAMSDAVVACLPTATVEEAENLMMAHDIRRLVVTDPHGRLLGMLSLDDIAARGAAANGSPRGGADLQRVALTLGEIARHTRGAQPTSPETPPGDVTDLGRNGHRHGLKTPPENPWDVPIR